MKKTLLISLVISGAGLFLTLQNAQSGCVKDGTEIEVAGNNEEEMAKDCQGKGGAMAAATQNEEGENQGAAPATQPAPQAAGHGGW